MISAMGIYQFKNTLNGKVYIGSAINIKKRLMRHRCALKAGTHENGHLQRSWDKHGEAAFEFSVLEEVTDKDMLLEVEQAYLDKAVETDKYFNILLSVRSGRLGMPHSEESKRKISEKAKGHTRNVGRKHPPEYGQQITARQIGMKMSEESKVKMSLAKKGGTLSPEHRAAISKAGKERWALKKGLISG